MTNRGTEAEDDVIALIRSRLAPEPVSCEDARPIEPDWIADVPFNDPPVPAAVLIALVPGPGGFNIIYTRRSSRLRAHSGQIAFPGGKLEAGDAHAGVGALREAEEEIGLRADEADILGYMPCYLTGTNYLISPVVALVPSGPCYRPNPLEVDEVFEVPLQFVVRAENFSRFSVTRGARTYSTWQLVHGRHTIWGITANITRNFRDLALAKLDREEQEKREEPS